MADSGGLTSLINSLIKPVQRIKDGRVVFKSLDDFKATIQGLKRMNESERNEWEKSMGHVSMISFYSNNDGIIMGTKNPIYKTMKEDKPYISDILFGRIVNSDGIFQIGNNVHKITNDGQELVTNEKYISSLEKNVTDSNIQSHPISVVLEPATKAPNNAKVGDEFPVAGREVKDGYIATAYFSRSNYWVYNSFAMKLRLEKEEGWWIFKSMKPKQASYLEITYAGFTYLEPFNPFGGSGSANCNDCSEAYAFLGEVWGPTTFTNRWVINGSYKATYDGKTVTFSN